MNWEKGFSYICQGGKAVYKGGIRAIGWVMWIAVLLTLAIIFCNYTRLGIAEYLPSMGLATSIAAALMMLHIATKVMAKETGDRKFRVYSKLIVVVVALEWGLAGGELMKHDNGDRAKLMTANADVSVQKQAIIDAETKLASLANETDSLVAEVGGMNASRDQSTRWDDKIEQLQASIWTINNDGKRETRADLQRIAEMQGEIAVLESEKRTTAIPAISEVAGKQAQLEEKRTRLATAQAALAAMQAQSGATQVNAEVIEEGQFFIFGLALHLSEWIVGKSSEESVFVRDLTSGLIVIFSFLIGLVIQAVYGEVLTAHIVKRRYQEKILAQKQVEEEPEATRVEIQSSDTEDTEDELNDQWADDSSIVKVNFTADDADADADVGVEEVPEELLEKRLYGNAARDACRAAAALKLMPASDHLSYPQRRRSFLKKREYILEQLLTDEDYAAIRESRQVA